MPDKVEMPTWRCHKKVHAFKIGKIEGHRIWSEDGSMSVDVTGEFIDRHPLNKPGYFVRYADGYESFSPAQAFEEGYTQIV